ncbi:MAG: hydantoinase/oxoprolinase family protein [Desulfovibrio sp.]|jgi:N-methylhydantoinase A/oxoprolinase/acetone carboxylase beta subunit|nr:hydantoinase/oxoprolinase family protein [Desulfovibrio sp.]
MNEKFYLGIDAGGTHTDAVLLRGGGPEKILLACAKVKTCHEDIPSSVSEALAVLIAALGMGGANILARTRCVTLGTTLAVNALVQNKADAVGLVLSAGPGLNPLHSAIGNHVCLVPGGLDHRGLELRPLEIQKLAAAATVWKREGVSACACVGKFSPRNPAHERLMAETAAGLGFSVTQGSRLSGALNFPRRIATAYYNAAVERLHLSFLNAVEKALVGAGVRAPVFLLKADGGAVPLALSRRCPVQSILSGPAASVMGILALCPSVRRGCSLLLDMGGTTTDIALALDGSPVVERDGMLLAGRRTLVRSLASVSVGVGGDSLIVPDETGVCAGPLREGPAMAFGGGRPTLLDAFNTLNAPRGEPTAGNTAASIQGMAALSAASGLEGQGAVLAEAAVEDGLKRIQEAARILIERVNARPVYTLAALRSARGSAPERIVLVGGPAPCVGGRLEKRLGLPLESPLHADVANAVGAGLTLPTASLEVYADTGQGMLRAPALGFEERIGRSFTLDAATARAKELLVGQLAKEGVSDTFVEVLEAELFATLSDSGYGSRDMRVVCQAAPGLAGRLSPE